MSVPSGWHAGSHGGHSLYCKVNVIPRFPSFDRLHKQLCHHRTFDLTGYRNSCNTRAVPAGCLRCTEPARNVHQVFHFHLFLVSQYLYYTRTQQLPLREVFFFLNTLIFDSMTVSTFWKPSLAVSILQASCSCIVHTHVGLLYYTYNSLGLLWGLISTSLQ